MAAGEVAEGKRAPAFSGKTHTEERVALADYKGRALVFFWYPKAMTPG